MPPAQDRFAACAATVMTDRGGFTACDPVLTGPARVYLETWVIPALEMILPGEKRDTRLARSLIALPAKREG